jgi:hypothetical protein
MTVLLLLYSMIFPWFGKQILLAFQMGGGMPILPAAPQGAHLRNVSRQLPTTVSVRLTAEQLAVPGATPETYLPGVTTRVAEEEESTLVLNSMKFMTAFDDALRAESPTSEVLATMALATGL